MARAVVLHLRLTHRTISALPEPVEATKDDDRVTTRVFFVVILPRTLTWKMPMPVPPAGARVTEVPVEPPVLAGVAVAVAPVVRVLPGTRGTNVVPPIVARIQSTTAVTRVS